MHSSTVSKKLVSACNCFSLELISLHVKFKVCFAKLVWLYQRTMKLIKWE